jgi:hypothetical protein
MQSGVVVVWVKKVKKVIFRDHIFGRAIPDHQRSYHHHQPFNIMHPPPALVILPILALTGARASPMFDVEAVAAAVRAANTTWIPVASGGASEALLRRLDQLMLGVLGPVDDDLAVPGPRAPDLRGMPPLPASFDWRNKTGYVDCIGPVQNQLRCGSCWAVSAVEAFADRRCIAERRRSLGSARGSVAAMKRAKTSAPRIALSYQELVACDKMCTGLMRCCRGCTGGYPSLAWKFMADKGVVSAQCMPYNVTRSLLCPVPLCREDEGAERRDKIGASAGKEGVFPDLGRALWGPRKYKALKKPGGFTVLGGAPSIRRELLTHGPVQAEFTVYADFMTYTSGIYRHVAGKRLGLHAVKVVGWGTTEDGEQFWECQNSWGRKWGVDGTFKIAVNAGVGFEEKVQAGEPCLEGDVRCFPNAAE